MHSSTPFRGVLPARGAARGASGDAAADCGGRGQAGVHRPLRAVLFDLDDTLFDHSHCSREALSHVHAAHACFSGTAFDDFVSAHTEHLEVLHREVIAGSIALDAAREERFRRLLVAAGGNPDLAAVAAGLYRTGYVSARRAVRGAADTLAILRTRAPIVVVSNNLLAEQRDKIQQCGLAPLVDVLVVSEEAGAAKPDPAIFEIALRRAGAEAGDAAMIGDSWAADVAGAHAAGILPIWFNPSGRPAPDAPRGVFELRGFEPPHEAAAAILAVFERHAARR